MYRRCIYGGSIEYAAFDSSMDTSIAMRALVHSDSQPGYWAGGGIVADSDLDAGHQETFFKVEAIWKLLAQLGDEYVDCENWRKSCGR